VALLWRGVSICARSSQMQLHAGRVLRMVAQVGVLKLGILCTNKNRRASGPQPNKTMATTRQSHKHYKHSCTKKRCRGLKNLAHLQGVGVWHGTGRTGYNLTAILHHVQHRRHQVGHQG
jgi:hypothetical protein